MKTEQGKMAAEAMSGGKSKAEPKKEPVSGARGEKGGEDGAAPKRKTAGKGKPNHVEVHNKPEGGHVVRHVHYEDHHLPDMEAVKQHLEQMQSEGGPGPSAEENEGEQGGGGGGEGLAE